MVLVYLFAKYILGNPPHGLNWRLETWQVENASDQ